MKRILVANRGEIACRILRSCRRLGLETVAVHSDADAASLHVSLADRSVSIGGSAPAHSYLASEKIVEAALSTGADAVHPGYGFLAEDVGFARLVTGAGLIWIGPDPKSINDMGDKERARSLAKAAGVPVLPGSPRFAPGALEGIEDAARELGMPLLVKSCAGGGGIGMRCVDRIGDLLQSVESTQNIAARAFGDGTIYLERYIANARHVEVQLLGFGNGVAIHLHERDCSIQRRFQKVIEESPAPGLPDPVRQAMFKSAVALCAQEHYRGVGTVEYVLDIRSKEFYFLEMNTRIQVEHPVTEMVTGQDLVELQLRLAGGQPVPLRSQADVAASGHSIECRVYAERPAKGFLPAPGVLSRFDLPACGSQIRIDTGLRSGDRITHHYDPMIAKVIVHQTDRDAAIDHMLETLAEISVEGVETNLSFLKRTVGHGAFRAGQVHTGFIERHSADLLF
jgi:3-methylcrotonyl-CoA carboxylase alpha subunit